MKQQLALFGLSIVTFSASTAFASQTALSQTEYISKWSSVAVENMKTYKIPASIILAQGSLESGNGNSPLAVQANNHFGIKCSNWNGDRMYFDDDSKGECFRKYASAAESYRDHSTFLTSKERYASLFQLNIRDYKAWARGLKKAGYATHPQYAEKLIDIIERMKLYEYDYQVDTPSDELKGTEILAQTAENEVVEADSKSTRKKTTTSNSSINARSQASLAIDASYLSNALHAKKENSNKVAFVVARKGDTYYKLAKEFDLALWQLYRYNDFEAKKDLLDEGDIVYLEPKRNRSKDKNAVYIAKTTVQLCQVSQSEGIKLKKLEKMNPNLTNQEAIQKGQKVLLR